MFEFCDKNRGRHGCEAKSILPSVNSPLVGRTEQHPFRLWCQTTLPLVYDDSLSYYEVVCKVNSYINNLISDTTTLETCVTDLFDAYASLREYVNNYFDGTAFQQLVNDKLDEMAEGGAFDDVPTENSSKPVKSGGVYMALADKQDTLAFDNTPTENSSNPVTSGGVFYALSGKVNAEANKGLSTNDYTTAEKTKLGGIEPEAKANVQSDWNQSDTTADDFIKNKPAEGTLAEFKSYVMGEQ